MKKKLLPPAERPTARCTPTPPMLACEIARLFHAKMRAYDLDGVMSQDSARLIMRTLAREGECSQLDLVHRTHLKAPTVSVTIRRMESEGLVERRQDAMDLRVTRVRLSPKGNAHHEQVLSRLRETDETAMQGFTKEEKQQLLHFLERMRDNILPAYSKDHSCDPKQK